jgi:two-component system, sensor histidine kinase
VKSLDPLTFVPLVEAPSALGPSLTTVEHSVNSGAIQKPRLPEMSDQERLLSIAVHDLKNPLHSIVLFIAALKQSTDPQRTAYLIDRLDRSTRGLDALFKRLLDMSRMDLGKMPPNLSVFDLKALFQTLQEQFSAFAGRKDLRFSVTIDESVFVRSDPVMTTEILINLLSNAFRYTHQGAISLRGHVQKDQFLIEVCDTGEGIAADRLPFIFEEFTQVSNQSATSSQGLGLGLAIVQRLAKNLGTKVTVQSEIGRGSVFRFALPLSDEKPPSTLEPAARKELKGLLVLVIDDDAYTLAAMEAILVASGSFVILARSLAEAEQKLEDNERFPDIIVCEALLKDQHSYGDVRTTCAGLMGQELPLLVITKETKNLEDAFSQTTGIARQRTRFIKKPAGSEEILDCLCQLISNLES